MTNQASAQRLQKVLWATQVVLAVVFLVAGAAKAFLAPAELFAKLPDLATLPLGLVRLIGIAELAAAIGLLLPSATRIAPALTPVAAIGLVMLMLGAAVFNMRAGHPPKAFLVLAIAPLAAFVAWGRFRLAPIEGRDRNRVLRLGLGPGSQA